MVWLTWIGFYALAAYLYLSGVIIFTREPINFNIYIMVFLAVLLASIARGWQTRHKEFSVFAIIFALNFTAGHLIWSYSGGYLPSVAGHMVLHTVLAIAVLHFTKSKTGAVVCLLFVLDVVWAALAITGVFPARPWPIFTGFYYGDAIAYTGHLAMVIFGLSCGDGGPLVRNWLNRLRGYSNENIYGLGIGSDSIGLGSGRRHTHIYARSNCLESSEPIRGLQRHPGPTDRTHK